MSRNFQNGFSRRGKWMTKKSIFSSQPSASNDFFSDLAEDLKNQVEELNSTDIDKSSSKQHDGASGLFDSEVSDEHQSSSDFYLSASSGDSYRASEEQESVPDVETLQQNIDFGTSSSSTKVIRQGISEQEELFPTSSDVDLSFSNADVTSKMSEEASSFDGSALQEDSDNEELKSNSKNSVIFASVEAHLNDDSLEDSSSSDPPSLQITQLDDELERSEQPEQQSSAPDVVEEQKANDMTSSPDNDVATTALQDESSSPNDVSEERESSSLEEVEVSQEGVEVSSEASVRVSREGEQQELTSTTDEGESAQEASSATEEEAVSPQEEAEEKRDEESEEGTTALSVEDEVLNIDEASKEAVKVRCPHCGREVEDPIWCDFCGVPIGEESEAFEGSQPESIVQIGAYKYKLSKKAIFKTSDRIVWQGERLGDERSTTPFLIEELSPRRYQVGYKRMPDLPDLRVLRPDVVQENEDRTFLIFRKPSGHRLKERLQDPSVRWSLDEIQHIIKTIGYTLARIHELGKLFLLLDARHIWMEDDKNPLLLSVERLYTLNTPYPMRPMRKGFSAPEVFQPEAKLGPYTDVFSLGALLHYLISHAPLFNHLDFAEPDIPSPRVYNPEFPVGLTHVVLRACHPNPAKRYQRISQFLGAFDRAINMIKEREAQPDRLLNLAIAHDIHIGVNKGRRTPVNQDALFWRYDKKRGKGLFIIADGVSHCNYGSGDRASSIVIEAARKRWDTLVKMPIMDQKMTTEQRRHILSSIVDAANITIGKQINQEFDKIEGYVEDVMGSTWVAGFLDGNKLTIANLGDSRAYLKTDEFIEQISIDHDYKTAQLQMHMDLRSIASLMGGSLITRCVGSFQKTEEQKLNPRELDIDFFELTLLPGDIILLCSDGLSDYAGATEEESLQAISQILEAYPDPLSACFWSIALANQHGGGDNISLIEIKVLE